MAVEAQETRLARLSTVSARALDTLESLGREVDDVEAAIAAYERLERGAPDAAKHAALGELRQLNGRLDKLQAERVDAVCTAELESGRDEARAERKRLNGRLDALRPRVQAAVGRLSRPSALPRERVDAADPLALANRWSAPQPRVQRFSTISAKALDTLDALEGEVGGIEAKLAKFDDVARYGNSADRDAAKGALRQLNGTLDTLQFERVDAVATSELDSGKLEARGRRRALNARIEALRPRVEATRELLRCPPPPPEPEPPVAAVAVDEVELSVIEDPLLRRAIKLTEFSGLETVALEVET